jgi:hypothetical protein
MKYDIKKISKEIVEELSYDWNGKKINDILYEKIDRACDLTANELKEDLLNEVLEKLEKENINVSM